MAVVTGAARAPAPAHEPSRASTSRDLLEAIRILRQESDRVVASRLLALLGLVVAAGVLGGVAPLALKGMVDAVTDLGGTRPTASMALIVQPCALYLLALGCVRVLGEMRGPLLGAAEQRFHARLRRRYLHHLLAVRTSYHLDQRTGALAHRLQQAITGYQIVFFNLVNNVAPVAVEVATVTFVLLHLGQPALTATFGFTALVHLALLGHRGSGAGHPARDVTDAGLDVQVTLTDTLLNVETVKCFGAEEHMAGRFSGSTARLEDCWARLQRDRARTGLVLTATFTLSMAASLTIAARAAVDGTLGVGGFVLANIYMLQLARPLEMLGTALRDLSQATQFIRPLLDVLAQPTEDRTGSRRPDTASDAAAARRVTGTDGRRSPGIVFRDVHFGYGAGPPVLRGLDLDIPGGRTTAFVGATGSGKSSVARLLLRLHEPGSGRILLDGIPIDTLALGDLRAGIGLVPQDIVLFNDSLASNIAIGRAGASQRDIEQAARVAGVHDAVCSFPEGYDTVVGERGLKLSGGERQRIAIARAVLRNPPVWILDEATSMMDGLTERAILDRLRLHTRGSTMVIIAHRLRTIAAADQIVVIEAGRVAQRGRHDELLASGGPYARLWRAQNEDPA